MSERSPFPRRDFTAFTLVELLAASAAAAVLMVGILMVVVVLSRDRTRMKGSNDQSIDARRGVVEVLRRDLTNARWFHQSEDGKQLVLGGFGSIDPQTRVPNQRSAEVIYRVTATVAGPCLLRRQAPLDDEAHSKSWAELVAIGVSSLRIAPATIQSPLATGEITRAATLAKPAFVPVPDRIRLTLSLTAIADTKVPNAKADAEILLLR